MPLNEFYQKFIGIDSFNLNRYERQKKKKCSKWGVLSLLKLILLTYFVHKETMKIVFSLRLDYHLWRISHYSRLMKIYQGDMHDKCTQFARDAKKSVHFGKSRKMLV